ncbi:monovalent cation/H+ antiporter subunit E [Halovivax limisalsi]|uniref:monovalent cation/H+ antiporter subunit E n=1 Tax=Halovivax limisalsi TaxID=1453760 RepID=UPI001FFC47EF|nr:monovalent cation/H+ antiporter subunit E [Halovivax limisalsi]
MTDTAGGETTGSSVLVLVSDSPTVEETARYAARSARELAAETDRRLALTIATPGGRSDVPGPHGRDPEAILATAADAATEAIELTDPDGDVEIETETLFSYRYPFDPYEYADAVTAYAADHAIGTVILDPPEPASAESTIVGSLVDELREANSFDVEIAPVERETESSSLVTRGGVAQFLSLSVLSFGFYVLVGGFGDLVFDLATGAVTAIIVAGVLSRVTFETRPRPVRMLSSVARWLLYVPYLGWKILVANVQIAYVVLHPSLPIDPSMERFEPGVWGGLPIATLGNSITLTPGTLTVDVEDRELVVHSLTRGAREDLLDGGLERAVRFVFYGRTALPYPSPRERNAAEDDST